MIRRPELLRKGVLLRPLLPIRGREIPLLAGHQVLIGGGQGDMIVPASASKDLHDALQAAGAQVSLYWHPGGHALGQQDLETVKVWLESR
jgi:phospholipase/carboxylesterase